MDKITDINSLDINKTYTYADYLTWQFKQRIELIKGRLFKMSPAPARRHQDISGALHGELYSFLKKKTCKVYSAPFDVRFPKNEKNDEEQTYTVVQPDICVVCDRNKLDRRGCNGAPDIIIEVLSPATTPKDLNEKFHLYEESFVKEYWVVYPGENILEIFINDNGKYLQSTKYTINDTIQTSILPGLKIKLDEIFEEEF